VIRSRLDALLFASLLWLVVVTGAGCSLLATKEAAIGCQVADIATTYRALRLNSLAVETNPLPLPLLLALKIGLIVWIWNSDWDKQHEASRAAVTVIGCLPVPGNLKAARGPT
jgi:hypothetical protein